jgi:hypothetical protein
MGCITDERVFRIGFHLLSRRKIEACGVENSFDFVISSYLLASKANVCLYFTDELYW